MKMSKLNLNDKAQPMRLKHQILKDSDFKIISQNATVGEVIF